MASVPRDQVSASCFYQVTEVAWGFLCPATQQAIRETSSAGRTLHDSHVTDLVVRLGPRKPDKIDSEDDPDMDGWPPSPPTPSELRSTLAAIVRQGARVQCLQLRFLRNHHEDHGHVQAREKQLLAVMRAMSGSPVATLILTGGVPLSLAVAEAVHGSLPNLKELVLDFAWRENDLPAGRPDEDEEDVAQYYYGAMQLLTLCGPRLTQLGLLGGVENWPALAFQALRQCTALKSLALEAGSKDGSQLHCFEKEAAILGTVVQLTGLRSLYLRTIVDRDDPDSLDPHASCMARLSALTALTSLRLELSPCYEHHGDSWDQTERNGDDHEYWCYVVDAHRNALLAALRAMPQLQRFDCPTLWLRPSEAAALTALTRLRVKGLLPPAAGEARGRDNKPQLPLPPLLQDLALSEASPRLLASLQVPQGFKALHVGCLCFGMSDVARHHQLLPETVAAVGPAVRLMTAFRPKEPLWDELVITADGAAGMLIPRDDVPEGHAEWLGQLAGLGGVQLVLCSLDLQTEDLCYLAYKLGDVTGLTIEESSFPVAALSGLLGLRTLKELRLDMHYSRGLTRSALETALAVLCGEAPALRRVKCTRCPLRNCGELQAALRRRLRREGKDGIYLTIRSEDESDSLSESA